jgi:hypothetical protein
MRSALDRFEAEIDRIEREESGRSSRPRAERY